MTRALDITQLAARLPARLRPLLGQGPTVIAVRIVAAGLALGAQVLASRLIGAEDFGRYAITLVWLLMLGHSATLGTNQLICRSLSSYLARNEPGQALGLLRFAISLAGGVSIALALLGLAAVHSGLLDFSATTLSLATMALIFVPLLTLQDYLEAISRGLDKPLLGIAPSFLVRQLALIGGLGTAFALGMDADAVLVLSFTLGGLVLTVLFQAGLLFRTLRAAVNGADAHYDRWSWFCTALPMAAVDLSEMVFKNGDILVLGLFVASEHVAIYFAATRISQILDYVPYGVSAVTAQKYAALHAGGDGVGLQHLIAKATLANVAVIAAMGLAIAVAAPWLLGLFGKSYGAGVDIVMILTAGLLFASLLGPGEDVLNMLGQERICSLVHIMVLLLAICLLIIIVPNFGIAGAAGVSALVLGVRAALLCYFAYSRLGLVLPIGLGFGWATGGRAPERRPSEILPGGKTS